MSNRTDQEYRALIRGWRIRLQNGEITQVIIKEMENEVPDFISSYKPAKSGGDSQGATNQ